MVQARQEPQRQQGAKGYPLSFFPIAPHLQRGNMRKNDFFGRQGICAPELRGRRGLTSVRRENSRVPFPCRGRFTAVGPDMGKALGHRFLSEHDSFMSEWNERHLGSGVCRRDRRKKVVGRLPSERGLPPHNLFSRPCRHAERTQVPGVK